MKQDKLYQWKVSSEEAGQSLQHFLHKKLQTSSSIRSIKKAIEAHLCTVNGKIERFASRSVEKNDHIEFSKSWEELIEKKAFSHTVIFEDPYLFVINKPPGWVSHEGSLHKVLKNENLHLIHRLDKQTTGVLLFAKSEKVKKEMIRLFSLFLVEKSYLAIVDGKVEKKSGRIQNYLRKKGSFEGQSLWGSSKKGHLAITYWERLDTSSKASLLLCRPITGKTHQIRVHLSELGHPVLGDSQYAKSFSCPLYVQRQQLHCSRIEFSHPITQEKIKLLAPLFPDMKKLGQSLFAKQSMFK